VLIVEIVHDGDFQFPNRPYEKFRSNHRSYLSSQLRYKCIEVEGKIFFLMTDLVFCVVLLCLLCSEFCVVMSVNIST